MVSKKERIIHIGIIFVLIIAIAVSIDAIIKIKSKEINAVKKFMTILQEHNAIDPNFNIKYANYKLVKLDVDDNNEAKNSVIVAEYGVDLDGYENIIGFSNKSVIGKGSTNISEEEAITKAELYLSRITDEELVYKEVVKSKKEEEGYYTIIFSKYFQGYPYEDHFAIVKINKSTGYLDGYSNMRLDHVEYLNKFKVEETEALKVAKDHLRKLELKVEDIKKSNTAYVINAKGQSELTYVFEARVTSKDNKNQNYKILVGVETGEIVNMIDDTIRESEAL